LGFQIALICFYYANFLSPVEAEMAVGADFLAVKAAVLYRGSAFFTKAFLWSSPELRAQLSFNRN
jgi:hypothetical protein